MKEIVNGNRESTVMISDVEDLSERHTATLRALVYGRLISNALGVVTRLGLVDRLREGPRSAEELALACRAHAGAIRRLLRALGTFEVFRERSDGTFELGSLGATLCRDVPGSLRWTTLMVSAEVGAAWERLETTVLSGESAFAEAFGTDFFSHLAGDPELRATFDRSQAAGHHVELGEFAEIIDFARYRRIVDVGGGDGAMLSGLVSRFAAARGWLLELPETAARASARFARDGVADRCIAVAGDFFAAVPAGGDLYLLSHVLHNWDDGRATDVLRVCREAMAPDATLMVIDYVVAEGTGSSARSAATMDLYMMSIFGAGSGRERTDDEFRGLLRDAGLAAEHTVRLPSGVGLIMAHREE